MNSSRHKQYVTCLAVKAFEQKMEAKDVAWAETLRYRAHSERVNMASRIPDPVVSRREMMADQYVNNRKILSCSQRRINDIVYKSRCQTYQDPVQVLTPNTSKIVSSQLAQSFRSDTMQNIDQKNQIMALPELSRQTQNRRRSHYKHFDIPEVLITEE